MRLRPVTGRRTAASVVELALLSPFLVSLFLGMFEISRGILVKEALINAANRAARTACIPGRKNADVTPGVTELMTAAGGTGSIDTLTPGTGILPMTYDVNHWDGFVANGKDPDGNTRFAADGYPHLNVYPSIKVTGNFGELSLNQSNNGASTIRDRIANGITAADVAALQADGLIPLSAHNPNSAPECKGNPGLKTTTIQEAGNHVGEAYLLPLFKPVQSAPGNYQAGEGQGSNYYYTIVRFVPVLITAVDATGNNKAIYVRPTAFIDPNSVYSTTPTPAQKGDFVFIGGKLVD